MRNKQEILSNRMTKIMRVKN